jgi:hypothetical protein
MLPKSSLLTGLIGLGTTIAIFQPILDIAEARTIASSMYFQGEYKNRTIYGSLNGWDGRACTVVNNKIITGRVSKDIKTVTFPKQEAKSIEPMILNPASSSRIPSVWINDPKFQECVQKTLYAQCFVKPGTKYYKWDNPTFRSIIKSRTLVYSVGTENNSYTRDKKVDSWAWLSFKPNNTSNDFIVNSEDLICKHK